MSIKEGDMVSIRQDFINRYKNVQESIIKAMDKALERAIGNKVIDFEKCEDIIWTSISYWGGLTEGGKESTWRKCE